jgi:hypothetical protein
MKKLQEQSWDWDKINAKLDASKPIPEFPTTTATTQDTSNNSNSEQPIGKSIGTVSGTGITDSEFEDFKKLLADKLNFELTDEKHKFLNAWRRAEGTKATNNPFATTINYKDDPNMSRFNLANRSQGVKNFSTVEYGADATAKTLNFRYYIDLVSQLRDNTITASALAENPALNTWGTGRLVSRVLASKSNQTKLDTTTKSASNSIDTLVNMNAECWRVWSLVNSILNDPEKFGFNQYKSWINDDEPGAAKHLQTLYDRILNLPVKPDLKFNFEFETIQHIKTHIEKLRKNFKSKLTEEQKDSVLKIYENFDHIDTIINFIKTELILKGKRGTLTPPQKFWYWNGKVWTTKVITFKWDYM